jgi:uncharacterized protein (TIGR02118 family)
MLGRSRSYFTYYQKEEKMSEVKLFVLYPYPTDIDQFDRDYQEHLNLLRKKMQIPKHVQPYMMTRFVEMPQGRPVYYQMFTMSFPSAEELQQAMSTREMQDVARDAARISSGGTPVILVGIEEA